MITLGSWQLELSLQVAMVAIPVAVYFLILGLLNSQRKPQILSERVDFSLLVAAFLPLCFAPLLRWAGAGSAGALAMVGGIATAIALASVRAKQGWVIYNISKEQSLRSISRALELADLPYQREGDQFTLDMGVRIRISPFPLLRNVSISVDRVSKDQQPQLRRFESELAGRLRRVPVEASPMAVCFVLISTAMIVAPLALMADRMPEMVRLLSDMIR